MIQIIASDMDGTLLDNKMVISDLNASAIKKAQSKGVHFMVSSGRAIQEVQPLLDAHNIKAPIISINGGIIYDEEGRILQSNPLTHLQSSKLVAKLNKAGFYYEVVTEKGVFSNSKEKRIQNIAKFLTTVHPETDFSLAMQMAQERIELTNINYIDDYRNILEDPHQHFYKIIVFDEVNSDKLANMKAELSKDDQLAVTSSGPRNIEINNVNAQKGEALKQYADRLNIPMDNVMAIGDNFNDVSMLKAAGVSYAMENGATEVKMMCNHLAKSNLENGVGHAILEQLGEE